MELLLSSVFFTYLIGSTISDKSIPRGVPLAKRSLYNPLKDFTCFDGLFQLPFKHVNDDFCDCNDGSDEPGTSACPNGIFHCVNKGYLPLNIPSSRVNDGICDCCDASDEYNTSKCTNNCDELGSEARALAEKQAQLFAQGNQLRAQFITYGKRLKFQKQEKLATLENERAEAAIHKEEMEELKNRAEAVENEAIERYKAEQESLKMTEAIEEQLSADPHITNDEAATTMEEGLDVPTVSSLPADVHEGIPHIEEIKLGTSMEREELSVTPSPSHEEWASERGNYNEENPVYQGEEEEQEEEEAEATPEEESKPEEPPEPEPVYDEQTQKLIDEAKQARSQFESAQQALQDFDREINQLKDSLSKDYGPEEEFATLEGQCFTYSDREYTYKLCPFDQALQIGKNGGSETRLGSWNGWVGNGDRDLMLYDKGQSCWNGPQRSTKVKVSCGLESALTGAMEPNKCEYLFEFQTPAACKLVPQDRDSVPHDEL